MKIKAQHTPEKELIGTAYTDEMTTPQAHTIRQAQNLAATLGHLNHGIPDLVKLYAAAPELLEAVKDYLADLYKDNGKWTIERLEALIAKAEGK